jgi:hypothetical protein
MPYMLGNKGPREILDIPNLFPKSWFPNDILQSYKIVAHFSK